MGSNPILAAIHPPGAGPGAAGQAGDTQRAGTRVYMRGCRLRAVNKLSGSQVDKLGRRLRNEEPPSVEDLRLLEQVRRAHEDARLEVVQALLAEGLQGTSRLKTTSTIIEKLQRESTMHLSRMQDIAGVRLVIEGTRLDQDRVVERILELFPDARMVDRREKPSYGYRAVHVIVRTQGAWSRYRSGPTFRTCGRRSLSASPTCMAGRSATASLPPTPTAAARLAELERRAQTSADAAARLAGMSDVRERLDHAERQLRNALEPLYAALHPAAVDDADGRA
jgi:hypothetical protein